MSISQDLPAESVSPHSSGARSRTDLPLYIISLSHALTHWYPATFYLVLPILAAEGGLNYTQVGVLITMRAVTQTIVNVPGGAIVDMVGRRGLLMALALIWSGVPYFFLGLTSNYAVILVCMGLMGIGNNLWHPAAISDLSQRYPDRRGYALSIHALGANLGDMLAPLVIGFLITFYVYSHVLIMNLIPGVLLGALFFIWMRGDASRQGHLSDALSLGAYVKGVRELGRNTGVLLLALVAGIRAMTQNGLSTFVPFYLMGTLGLGPALVGVYLAVIQAAGLVASPLSGLMSDRFGRKPLVSGGMLMTSVLVILMANLSALPIPGVDFTWLFVGVLGLLGFFLYAMRPALQAWSLDLVPATMGGTTVGLMFGAQSLFSAFSPAIGGVLADNYGLIATFYFIAGTILVANVVVMLVPDRLLTARAPVAATA